jgi:hypothetical protein
LGEKRLGGSGAIASGWVSGWGAIDERGASSFGARRLRGAGLFGARLAGNGGGDKRFTVEGVGGVWATKAKAALKRRLVAIAQERKELSAAKTTKNRNKS